MTDDQDFALIFKEEVIGKGFINARQQENQLKTRLRGHRILF